MYNFVFVVLCQTQNEYEQSQQLHDEMNDYLINDFDVYMYALYDAQVHHGCFGMFCSSNTFYK